MRISPSPAASNSTPTQPSAPAATTKGSSGKLPRRRNSSQSQTKIKTIPAGREPPRRPHKKDLQLHPSLKRKIRRDALIFAIVFALVFGHPTEVAAKIAYNTIQETLHAALSCHR